jgi:integrase
MVMTTGIRQRHSRRCSRKGRCKCSYEAFVYSKRDQKKIRKAFPTQAAAVAWRDDARSAVRRKGLRVPTSVTLREAGEAWLEGARAGVIRTRSGEPYKPATIRSYDQSLDLRVYPELGSMKLSEISRNNLQDLVDELVANGLSSSTVTTALLPVRAIYRRAHSRDEVAVNPTAELEMPAVRGGRDRIATPEECDKLLAALPRAGDRALWATAMYAGLRRGELRGVGVEEIDLAEGVIHVRWGWDPKVGRIATKNRKPRKVPIPAALRDYLDEHLLGVGRSESLAFGTTATSPFSGTALTSRTRRAWGWRWKDRKWVPVESRETLQPITLHECRHTFASLMIAAGVNAKALSTYMGHSTISITLDRYGHLMPGNEDEAACLLDAYLARCAPVSRQSGFDSTGFDRTPAESIPHG